MKKSFKAKTFGFVICLLLLNVSSGWGQEGQGSEGVGKEEQQRRLDHFESKIRPALIQYCYECHSVAAKEANGRLLLDSQPAMRKGGERGDVLNGSVEATLFWKAINYGDAELQMPPSGKMPAEVIQAFKEWIEQGAVDPRKEATSLPESAAMTPVERAASHWAYQLPIVTATPKVERIDWPKEPLDYEILAKMEAKGLGPSSPADRRTLIRRLYFDLLGLPPSIEEIDAFEKDTRSDAYAQLVQRLLNRAQFGERWARYWMDIVRYADTKGYVFQEDREYPNAYRYREWLIRSINNDMPYDQFVRYQLAGDRIDPENKEMNLDAMGMLTLGRRFLNNQNDIADDRIDVVTRGLMAMTVGCARCHDHKFDPVSMADYYSLHGSFVNSHEPGGDPSPLRLVDKDELKPSFIMLRGQPGNRGETIERKFVRFLSKDQEVPLNTGSGRIDLANAIVAPNNPLTARVYVNRVWDWLMGAPFVDTPSDFGLRCEPPVQQDVLDRLAAEFVADGWSTKRLVQRIVSTATYQQSSEIREDGMKIDPENRLWWKANRSRLDFESYRDAMLAVTGTMDQIVGGPSVKIHEAPYPKRRTIYAHIDRQNLPGLFRSFDFANPDAHSPRRGITTVPQQGLFALNSGMVRAIASELGEQAATMAQEDSSGDSTDKSIRFLFQKVLSRNPTADEARLARAYMQAYGGSESAKSPQSTWRYGYAKWDAEQKKLESFQSLPLFADKQWKGGPQLPDPTLGWVFLDEKGGHPGGTFAAVRRWVAPSSGQVSIQGSLQHKQAEGNGVRTAFVRNQSQLLGEWSVANSKARTVVKPVEVQAGDTIDFVVDCNGNENSDGFGSTFEITLEVERAATDGSSTPSRNTLVFKSKEHFSGGEVQMEFTGLAQFAQALLATNEFCFVD